MQARTRPRAILSLLAVTVLLPLAALLLGLWEAERGQADLGQVEAEQARLTQIVAALEARTGRGDSRVPDFGAKFRWAGQTYAGPLALTKAREALDETAMTGSLGQVRRLLPPVVIVASALAAGLSILVLLTGFGLGRVGRHSREALVRGFSWLRRLMPLTLGAQVVLATLAFVAAALFEASAILRPGAVSGGEIKLGLLAVVAALASLWVAGSTLLLLRRTLAALAPEPLSILGRTVSRDEALSL